MLTQWWFDVGSPLAMLAQLLISMYDGRKLNPT